MYQHRLFVLLLRSTLYYYFILQQIWMPLLWRDEPAPPISERNFFEDLSELDEWASTPRRQSKLEGLVDYTPRSTLAGSTQGNHGNLLVLHLVESLFTEYSDLIHSEGLPRL